LLTARYPDDPFPDIRRQAVPGRDNLAQAEISAGNVQTGGRGVNGTHLLHNGLWIWGRLCNSRRSLPPDYGPATSVSTWPRSKGGRPNTDASLAFRTARFGRIDDASASLPARVGVPDRRAQVDGMAVNEPCRMCRSKWQRPAASDRDHDLDEPGPWRGHVLDLCTVSYSHEANGFQVVWPFFNISL
jgi:hypothetical protein